MARPKGTFELSSNLEPNIAAPLDARTVVNTVADLTEEGSFEYTYIGMSVAVKDTGDIYVLKNEDTTKTDSWKKIGSGSGGDVDEEIDEESENPVQNKAIAAALEDKQDADDKMTPSDMDDVVNRIPGSSVESPIFDNIQDRPLKEVTPISDIISPLPGVTPRMMHYTEEEQLVGYWINDKPIYQKVIFGTLANTTSDGTEAITEIDVGVDVDEYIYLQVMIDSNNGAYFIADKFGQINFNDNKFSYVRYSARNGSYTTASERNKLRIANARVSWNGFSLKAIIQYTKTTD